MEFCYYTPIAIKLAIRVHFLESFKDSSVEWIYISKPIFVKKRSIKNAMHDRTFGILILHLTKFFFISNRLISSVFTNQKISIESKMLSVTAIKDELYFLEAWPTSELQKQAYNMHL